MHICYLFCTYTSIHFLWIKYIFRFANDSFCNRSIKLTAHYVSITVMRHNLCHNLSIGNSQLDSVGSKSRHWCETSVERIEIRVFFYFEILGGEGGTESCSDNLCWNNGSFEPIVILLEKELISHRYKSQMQQETVLDDTCSLPMSVLQSLNWQHYRFHQGSKFQF